MMATKKEMMICLNEKTNSNDGSKQPILALDLIRSILERLSFVDFHRARCVSSDWYSASKSCIGRVTNPTNPWLILFPKEPLESNNKGSCKLYDPRDKTSYIVRDIGFDIARSSCMASCGNWILMLDRRTDFHLVNVFTREKIHVPSLESTDRKEMIFKRTGYSDFFVTLHHKNKTSEKYSYRGKNTSIGKAVLWVDEKSKDYSVVWSYDKFFTYQKKEEDHDKNIWKILQPLKNEGCVDMVLKESKLYVLRETGVVTVFDFYDGGDSLMECASFKSPDHRYLNYYDKSLAVTLSGEVLFIASIGSYNFDIHKWDPESSKWTRIQSIGDEILLFNQGITVEAKDGAVTKNCIYYFNSDRGCVFYNIQTERVVNVYIDNSKDARWFFPIFG